MEIKQRSNMKSVHDEKCLKIRNIGQLAEPVQCCTYVKKGNEHQNIHLVYKLVQLVPKSRPAQIQIMPGSTKVP